MGSSSDIEITRPTSTTNNNNTIDGSEALPRASSSRSSVDLPSTRPKARRIPQTASNSSIPIPEDPTLTTTGTSRGKTSTSGSQSSKGKGKGKEREVITVNSDDEQDAFFNRRAPVQAKRKFGASKKKVPVVPVDSSSSASERSVSPETTSKPMKLPEWTRSQSGFISSGAMKAALANNKPNRPKRNMEVDSDEEEEKKKKKEAAAAKKKLEVIELSDSDDSIFGSDIDAGRDKKKVKSTMQELTREKSRSLTPPAPLAAFKIAQHLHNLHANLGPERHHPLPHSSPNASDSSRYGRRNLQDQSSDPVTEEESSDEERSNKVTINVIPVFDPNRISSVAARAVQAFETPRRYRVAPQSNFQSLFISLANILSVSNRSNIVMTHNSRRVYEFGNPASLKIRSEATFRCYTEAIWLASEEIRKNGRNDIVVEEVIDSNIASAGVNGSQTRTEREVSQVDQDLTPGVDLLKVTVRGSQSLVFSLAVKKTMLVSQLLKQYCKKFEIDQERIKLMWLEFDGEKLEMGKMLKEYDEIEDEETVDVRERKADE